MPTVCFNCESACGLLAYVDKTTLEVKKFEGNPVHPGSRGRNCAKGPATINQTYDPERILYPLKRVGPRGEGKWKRITWDEALDRDRRARCAPAASSAATASSTTWAGPARTATPIAVIQAWGVDGHNSHTNICSSGARPATRFWGGFDRPSPDYANARVILLISSHLETGHYFNPHAQRIIEGKMAGAKLITFDPRLSNTASMSDVWLPTWPGSETTVLLAIANYLIQNDLYDREFVRRWVNWEETLQAVAGGQLADRRPDAACRDQRSRPAGSQRAFDLFDRLLKDALRRVHLRARRRGERRCRSSASARRRELVANCDGKLATHTWRSASIGNLGGWQVARALFFLNVLTGSVGTPGGTSATSGTSSCPNPSPRRRPSTPGTSCTCRTSGRWRTTR